jgi:hypothetical protein
MHAIGQAREAMRLAGLKSEDIFVAELDAAAADIQKIAEALTHAVDIAEAKRDGNWDDLLQYRKLLKTAGFKGKTP